MRSRCHFPIARSLPILIACLAGGHHGLAEEPLLTPHPLPASVATAFENQQTSPHLLADPDYFVWCLTAMRWSDGKIHAYYARWPKRIGFSGWRTHSEIAHAVADSPAGPFRTTGVVVSSRNPQGWDSINAHNPSVCVADGKIYLYFVGNKIGDFYQPKDGNPLPDDAWLKDNLKSVHLSQLITVAVAEQPEGPFVLPDEQGNPEWLYIAVKQGERSGNVAVKLSAHSK